MNNGNGDKLDVLIDQVGRLTEGLTEVRLSTENQHSQFMAEIKELKTSIARIAKTSEQQAETAKIQADNVAQLIAMLRNR